MAQKSGQLWYEKKLSNAVMQTNVINCNIANKSCLLQLVHTKAIAASTQFCDFCTFDNILIEKLRKILRKFFAEIPEN